jgi:hypothetical protein
MYGILGSAILNLAKKMEKNPHLPLKFIADSSLRPILNEQAR